MENLENVCACGKSPCENCSDCNNSIEINSNEVEKQKQPSDEKSER